MNEKKIYEAITNIDDAKIAEAESFRLKRSSKRLVATISAAAVFVASMIGIFAVTNDLSPVSDVTPPIFTDSTPSPVKEPEYLTVSQPGIVNLLENTEKKPINAPKEDVSAELTDFSLNLFKEAYSENSNILISPLSLVSALGMSANGAQGETLSQMQTAFGTDIDKINNYVANYIDSVQENDNDKVSLTLANSIWYRNDGLKVRNDYLQSLKDYYNPSAYAAPFDDDTKQAINDWVSEQTGGMIDEIVNEIPSSAVSYLINALYFDAEWSFQYIDEDVSQGIFIAADGTEQDAEFMQSRINSYIETQDAIGFTQSYFPSENGVNYSFVALLPNEGISIDEFIAQINSEYIENVLNRREEFGHITVVSELPKFSFEYEIKMTPVLQSLGITDAFSSEDADFSAMGTSDAGNIFISEVLHKTTIEVAEKGTKSGAVSSIAETAAGVDFETVEVNLNRPFVFLIVDTTEHFPIFIGAVNTLDISP